MDELTATVEKIIYKNEENGFTVASVKNSHLKEPVCLTGTFTSLHPGEVVSCSGKWEQHSKYGRQFSVVNYTLSSPSDAKGIQKYLESGMIRGIGKAYAKKIVDAFGTETLQVIETDPDRLAGVSGIGEKRAEKIQKSFHEQRSIRHVMVFLKAHDVGTALAQKIYRRYGEESVQILQKDPYLMAKDLFGVGFKTADKLAEQIGFSKETPMRIVAGLEYVLKELSEDGHVCYPERALIDKASEILEVDRSLIHKGMIALEAEERIIRKDLVIDGEPVLFVWLRVLYLAEFGITRELMRLQNSPCKIRSVQEEKAVEWIQEKLRLKLAREQQQALIKSLGKILHIVTGGPGTGKSTITKALLGIHDKLTSKIVLAAPTGRAAKRLSEITKKKAFTIHSLLEFDFQKGGFKKGRENPIVADLIIIDEASMIDTWLMYSLLKAIPTGCRVVIIGDIDQLPSVGPGNVLKDLISSEKIPTTRLYHIFRQGPGSRIVYNAHQINKGLFPELPPMTEKSDFYFIEEDSPEEIANIILSLHKNKVPHMGSFHPLDDIQVLAPMRKGVIGIDQLNVVLQNALNPSNIRLTRMGRSFGIGDKVMQIRNNYTKMVFNGDIGRIQELDEEEETISVEFDQKTVIYESAEIEELVLAYAVSIHKYQGSECPAIILPIHTSHFKLLYKNLLYTGITRGKKLVILVGSKKAIAMAIHNQEVQLRHSGLQQMTREALSSHENQPTP
jgi:exodeoxyribonuclease V alpha subunit